MLRLLGISVLLGLSVGYVQKWQFEIADKLVEDFKSQAEELRNVALHNEFKEESLHSHESSESSESHESHDKSSPLKGASEFDFIIIGGGTSGAVIANRLSEVPEWKILLLEAGGTETESTQVPQFWPLLENTHYNWGYSTTPQNHSCLGMVDHKCSIPLGKSLGGSTAINSMVYTRGNKRDFDLWADHGNDNWCFADVLPFFKAAEDAELEHFDKKYHHRGGHQHLEFPQHLTILGNHVFEAGKKLGIHDIDYNGKHQMGMGLAQLTTNCGRRSSTAQGYLEPAVKRANLVIKPLSHVTKIVVSPHTKDVKGVQYLHDGKIFAAAATKEVVLAAGAINSAKILMLSGIGPKEECERLKIEPISDLHVGKNLKVHPTFIGLDFVFEEPIPEGIDDLHDTIKYLKYGKGQLTAPGTEALAYIKTEASKEHADYPDVELKFSWKYFTELDSLKGVRLAKEQYESLWKPLVGKKGVNIAVTLTHPKSTGYVTLHDNDPLHHPIIEPALLSDEDEYDFHTMLAGIKAAINFSHTEAFHKLGVKLNHNPVHGCDKYEFASEDYWGCAVKFLTITTGDVSGTTKMGPETDKEAVVNNHLKVYGVHKLRVADASVIPITITGGLTASTIMIGEKAAHMIKEDWK